MDSRAIDGFLLWFELIARTHVWLHLVWTCVHTHTQKNAFRHFSQRHTHTRALKSNSDTHTHTHTLSKC